MLIDMLHTYGMGFSYDGARSYQASLLDVESPFPDSEEASVQFVCDNADWNTRIFIGWKHHLIAFITPRNKILSSHVLRLEHTT